MGRTSRDHDAVPECRQSREPERVIFVHVQGAGQAQVATERLLYRQAPVSKKPLVLGFEYVGQLGLGKPGHLAIIDLGATIATVARNKDATIGKGGDGALAVVLTQGAVVTVGLDGETIELGTLP